MSQLLKERTQQVQSRERDLALREETVHRLRAELEQAQAIGSAASSLVGTSAVRVVLCFVLFCVCLLLF